MKMSTEPTCPGHKRNQARLNENQAVRLMKALIYFISPLYFILVSLHTATQQVFTECMLCAHLQAQCSGDCSSRKLQRFATSDFLASCRRISCEMAGDANSQPHLCPCNRHIWGGPRGQGLTPMGSRV